MMQRPSWEIRVRDPRRERWLRLLMLVLAIAIPVAWFASQWLEQQKVAGVLASAQEREALIRKQADELELTRRRLAVVESGESLTQQATEHGRQSIKLLEEEIYQLQQELATMKGLVAPAGKNADGVRIRSLAIRPGSDPQRFYFKLFLSRIGSGDPLEGRVKLEVRGRKDGKPASLDLAELSKDVSADGLAYSLRNFQSFPEGGRLAEIRLPAGFEPADVRVVASVNGQKQTLEKIFKWQAE